MNALLLAMRGRYSSNPIDKVCAIVFPFQKRIRDITLPIYDPSMSVSAAWDHLIPSITSTKMEFMSNDFLVRKSPRPLNHSPTIQLLRLFPHPSRHHWFPSWAQVQQYPDVSVRDNDPVLVTKGMDYSLRIMSGRIYRGCSLQLIHPPTPEKKAIYCCTMGGNNAQLVATVPGIELHISPKSKYVLVDISPDYSLWPKFTSCRETGIGHEHPPIWPESVIIICEEVDTLAHPADDTVGVTKCLSTIIRYRLRRVTTLEWDCRPLPDPVHWSRLPLKRPKDCPGHWLPFKPSLVHMRSAVCSSKGGYQAARCLNTDIIDMFCDPAALAGLWSLDGCYEEWDKRYPAYEVYLV